RKTTFRAEPLKALRVALVVLFEPVDQQTLTLRGRRETNVLTEEEEAEQSVMDAHVGALLFGCCLSSLFTPLREGAPPPKRADGAPPLQQPAGGCRLFLDPFLVPLLSTFARLKTRSGNVVFNTEYQKMHSPHSPVEELELMVTENRPTDELLKVKLRKLNFTCTYMGDLRSLCGQCGVDPRGSRMDIVSRLQQEMKNRDSYDKVFSQLWGASGGWAVVTCPCAVVYAVKFNIRAESPRDYADILLSFKHCPNITLYDFARGLATHTNQRVPETFRPHGSRLCEPTDGNIAQAAEGELKVNFPWLKHKQKVPDPDGHPLTGSSAHYALYDRFHEDNTKDKRDVEKWNFLQRSVAGSTVRQPNSCFQG
ncbi:unnamed protein product, partial [Menidia menidia]